MRENERDRERKRQRKRQTMKDRKGYMVNLREESEKLCGSEGIRESVTKNEKKGE